MTLSNSILSLICSLSTSNKDWWRLKNQIKPSIIIKNIYWKFILENKIREKSFNNWIYLPISSTIRRKRIVIVKRCWWKWLGKVDLCWSRKREPLTSTVMVSMVITRLCWMIFKNRLFSYSNSLLNRPPSPNGTPSVTNSSSNISTMTPTSMTNTTTNPKSHHSFKSTFLKQST